MKSRRYVRGHCPGPGAALVWHPRGRKTPRPSHPDKCPRFPAEIISPSVWRYVRCGLSDRDVEELMAARGVSLPYEAVRYWCRQFGPAYATQWCRRRPSPGDKGHVDEVCLTIHGARHDLGRAVDQDGDVLDSLVQRRWNTTAAPRVFRTRLKGLTDVPRGLITAKRSSYGAAKPARRPGVEHRQHRDVNTRAEHSHHPTRQRERRLQGFKSPGQAQRFLAAYGPIAQHCRPRRHRLSAPVYRQERSPRCQIWREVTGVAPAA
jgi:putative transposase